MYSQRDKPSSLNTITQNYVNSLREIQITDIASPYPATAKTFSFAPSMVCDNVLGTGLLIAAEGDGLRRILVV